MDPTIQVNIKEYILMNFTIILQMQIILHKKIFSTTWSASLGYSTNDEWRSFVLPITVKKSVSKGFCSA